MTKTKRYAILTNDDDYVTEYAELDGYSYPVDHGQIYDEIEAETRGKARAEFVKRHRRNGAEFTDKMSIRVLYKCNCVGKNHNPVWDCPYCGGNGWHVQEKAK